jgi:phosphoribosyl 1,2-cyclic phosphodiesterase
MNFKPLASSSRGNCYLVESDGAASLLLECGIPIKRIREGLNFGLSRLAACFVSHGHGDHSKAVPDMLKAGVDVYLPREAAEAIGIDTHHRAHIIKGGHQESVDGWTVLPFDLHHDAQAVGFLVADPDGDKLLFVPDTAFVQNRFQGVNLIAVECNYVADILSANIQRGSIPQVVGRRVRRSHMSLDTVIGFLKANDLSRCREIWLLHLSDGNSNEEIMRRRVQEETRIATYTAQQ